MAVRLFRLVVAVYAKDIRRHPLTLVALVAGAVYSLVALVVYDVAPKLLAA